MKHSRERPAGTLAGDDWDVTHSAGNQFLHERDWLVTTQRADGSVMYLVFIAPENDFAKLRPTFRADAAKFQLK